ncbi:MAG: lysozyme [Hyphomicrobium sp.]
MSRAKIGAAVIAAALVAAIPFIVDREGESLQAYKDSVGVWTICHGETFGVNPEDKLSKKQCDLLTQSRIGMFMFQVTSLLTVPLSPETLAAHTSFAYNIGLEGYARSSTRRLTNQGDLKNGCLAMMKWITAGGKDCSVRANNCYGLYKRRQDEVALCLSGVK